MKETEPIADDLSLSSTVFALQCTLHMLMVTIQANGCKVD